MHRLVPYFILEKHAKGQTSGHIDAFVLFADISGFSVISNTLAVHGQHGAEALAGLMRTVFDPLQKAVYAHGGFITTSAGDAFAAVFPANDLSAAERSLAAAWSILEHLASHCQQETRYGSFPIGVKLGLAYGEAQWGIVQSDDEERATYYFRGAAIDAAAGAEKTAEPGNLVITPAAFREIGELASGEWVDDHLRVIALHVDILGWERTAIAHRQQAVISGHQDAFFPQQVLSLPAVGEFRRSVNVFINLQEASTAEALAEFLRSVFALQASYGGVLNSLDFGDKGCKLLLFWGAPLSYENDVGRALDFLLALQNESLISLKAGVTLRTGFAGFVGGTWHEEYTCYGYGVSLSARLMSGAPWGRIWVDEPVAAVANHAFDMKYEEHLALKGFKEPQAVYVLLDRKHEDVETYDRGRMIGR